MMDWADKKAKELHEFVGLTGDDEKSSIATALRKAKADGVREAMTALAYVRPTPTPNLSELADKIERGES